MTELSLTPEQLPPVERLLLVADTHMPRMAKVLPPPLRAALEEAELVMHAGDIVSPDALAMFEAFAPVVAVAGNNDGAFAERLPTHRLLEWRGFRLGLTHGHEGKGRTTPDRALSVFAPYEVDAVVFGHSHVPLIEERGPLIEERGAVLLVNPGSPSDKRRQVEYSFGWLEDDGVKPRARLEFYANKR